MAHPPRSEETATSGSESRRMIVPAALQSLDRHHRDALEQLFGPSPPPSPIDPELRFLFVCFTNRCGSNYLAQLIASTGVLNVAEEVFNASAVQEHAQRTGFRSLHEYINFLGRRLNMSGWLTTKLGLEQLIMLTEAGILDEIAGRSRFILLERRDRVAQAVSRIIATQNLQWTSEQVAAIPDAALVYSREWIERQVTAIAFQNHAFYRFFASNGLAPRHLAYEALMQSPQTHLAEIGAWLGFERFIGDPEALRIERQESPIKQAWRERYHAGL